MIEKLIILSGVASILVLVVSQKYKLLCWVWLGSMVVGPRRAYFEYQDVVREIYWKFEIIPFTVLLLVLTLLTVRYIGRTLNRWDLGALAILAFGVLVGRINDVPLDQMVRWIVPLGSVYLTKHLVIVFVRSPKDEVTATRIFIGICFFIGLSFILTAVGITFGGFLLPSKAYGVVTDSGLQMVTRSEGFWGDATVAGIVVIAIILLPHLKAPFLLKTTIAGILFASVLFSGKRLAVLSLGLVVGFVMLGLKDRRKRLTALGLGTLMVIGLLVFLPETGILDRFDEAQSALTGERQNDQRMIRFSLAASAIAANPILGTGAGGISWIHNAPLEILASLGLLGIPVLISLIVPVINSYKVERLANPWACSSVIYLASPFMLEAVLNRPENLAFLGFFIGMTEVHQRLQLLEKARNIRTIRLRNESQETRRNAP